MFSTPTPPANTLAPSPVPVVSTDTTMDTVDRLLEQEKLFNKTEPWNRLDKQEKIQKLHKYAETYGKDNGLPSKEIKTLKQFFVQCIERNKLTKTKEVVCNKDTRDIQSIPSLHFNPSNRMFALKIVDTKRVSTIKSLTPKRLTEKNREEQEEEEEPNLNPTDEA
jgi:hypothetical protein